MPRKTDRLISEVMKPCPIVCHVLVVGMLGW